MLSSLLCWYSSLISKNTSYTGSLPVSAVILREEGLKRVQRGSEEEVVKGEVTLGFCCKEFITPLGLITKCYNPTDCLYNTREDGNEFLVESCFKIAYGQ